MCLIGYAPLEVKIADRMHEDSVVHVNRSEVLLGTVGPLGSLKLMYCSLRVDMISRQDDFSAVQR